jgi:hypothetical protein
MNTYDSKSASRHERNAPDRAAEAAPRGTRARVLPIAALLTAAAVTLASAGCGRRSSDSSAASAVTEPVASAPTAVVASAPNPSDTTGARVEKLRGETLSRDAVPPDVEATAVDSVVTPGAVVEINAKGSPDVVDMGLSDGIGREQPFAYDSTMKVWRALYRVPIHSSKDKVGLAVTATNDSGHWRKVWVFLNLQP